MSELRDIERTIRKLTYQIEVNGLTNRSIHNRLEGLLTRRQQLSTSQWYADAIPDDSVLEVKHVW